jgi:Txe/YoeB family toxin of Txe-Axe toxin-antitoxin module
MNALERILDFYSDEEFLKADGLDDAVLGVENYSMRLVYSIEKCIKILKRQGMSEIDAIEHLNYNVIGAYVGEQTPIFIYTLKD